MVLGHYCAAFSPALPGIGWLAAHRQVLNVAQTAAVGLAANGDLAVSLFFLISGMVLTLAFEGALGAGGQILRRYVRLGLPMAASVLIAATWFFIWPQAHALAAAAMGGNPWLGGSCNIQRNLGAIANEVLLSGMVFGHLGATLFSRRVVSALGLIDLSNSYNPPIWTLHLEFWGSLLVLALVTLRHRLSPGWYRMLCLALLVGLISHPLVLFVIGGIAARAVAHPAWERLSGGNGFNLGGAALLLLGIAMTMGLLASFGVHGLPPRAIALPLNMQITAPQSLQSYGAVLIFFGILMLPAVQAGFSASPGRLLGRYSFSLYLVHFPILFTLSMASFIRFEADRPGLALMAALAVGLVATLPATWLFERWIDRPCIGLSHRLSSLRPDRRQAVPRLAE